MDPEQLPQTLEERKKLKDLGWYDAHEVVQRQRNQMAAGDYIGRIQSSYIVFCTRHVWSEWDFRKEDNEIEKGLGLTLNSKRKCPYFFPHNPSYSPIEHRELQRDAKTRRLLIKGMILAAVIGAFIGVAAVVVVEFIAPSPPP
jgi:hypothetical protein